MHRSHCMCPQSQTGRPTARANRSLRDTIVDWSQEVFREKSFSLAEDAEHSVTDLPLREVMNARHLIQTGSPELTVGCSSGQQYELTPREPRRADHDMSLLPVPDRIPASTSHMCSNSRRMSAI